MQADYFPAKEDIILQNEGAADIYVIVSGAVNMLTTVNGNEQVYVKVAEGDMFGEVVALCNIPQPFTCRTAELSQLLRISKTKLTEIIQEHSEDSNILMNNLFQKLKLQESLPEVNQPDRGVLSKYELFHVPRDAWLLPKSYLLHYTEQKSKDFSNKVPTIGDDTDSTKSHGEATQMRVPQQENSHNESNCKYWATDGMMDKEEDLDDIHINCETKTSTEEFCIQIKSEDSCAASSWQTRHATMQPGSPHKTSGNIMRSRNPYYSYIKAANKRVTIHIYPHNAIGSTVQNGKLINLPGSLEELFEIGSQKFPGFHPAKVVSRDCAEIDDIGVIRDGDDLYLLEM